MSNSTLVTVKVPAHTSNYTAGRTVKISEITIHHMAGVLTAAQCGALFARAGREGSSHYGVGNDGSIGLYVDEKNTAWANSNWAANCRAVTIETSNSAYGGNWLVSDTALNALIKLVADIAKRNGLGKLVKGKNLTWHSMYAATVCPGAYLLSKMDYIAEKANEINYPKEVKISMGEITGINTSRGTNALVLITDGRATTGFNKWGVDVIINSKGIITQIVDGKANTPIPKGCICLSGHNTAGWYLKQCCKVGARLKIG